MPTPYAIEVVLDGGWKLLADSLRPTELFRLPQDHRELYNVLDNQPAAKDSLLMKLTEFDQAPRFGWEAVGLDAY